MTVSAVLNNDGTWKVSGLNADAKPDAVPEGSFFFETDTGVYWCYISSTWVKTGPTGGQNEALVGSFGTPGSANVYVTETDPRLDGTASTVAQATYYTAVTASTESETFVDGLGGNSISPPSDGDYFVIFMGECSGSNSSNQLELAVGKNSTTVAQADTARIVDTTAANDIKTFDSGTILTSLVTGDTIHGIFRKSSGPGSSSLYRRRLIMLKVS